MNDAPNEKSFQLAPGGSFLIEDAHTRDILVPEDFGEDLLAIGQTAGDFGTKKVLAQARAIDSKEGKANALAAKLVKEAADLGMCMLEIPEAYGGLDLGFTATMLVTEKITVEGSFGVTWGGHVGIGTLPIVFFGNEAQKEQYLPKSATCENLHAYCLSESGSGSDALGARTTAVLNDAGTHYVLNGEKMWISNGGWADVYIVFAQVKVGDDLKFSAFIVERGFPGVTPGPEEHKLGLRGSSTTPLVLDDAQVPVENLLGEVGKGHKIAFHILNIGRFKLAAGESGYMKVVMNDALGYAVARKQFNTRIADFGAIRAKFADMAKLTWVNESMVWRLAGLMESATEDIAKDDPKRPAKLRKVIEEYAIESSIAKVFSSEAFATVVDESVQIHGGAGFVEDYLVEKYFRDGRVHRIFEGTSEVNRLLIPGMLLKRAMRGRLALMPALGKLGGRLEGDLAFTEGSLLEQTEHAVELVKMMTMLGIQAATSKWMMALKDHQQTLLCLADLCIAAYAADSAAARTRILVDSGRLEADSPQVKATALYAAESLDEARQACRQVIIAAYEADAGPWLAKLGKLDQPFNVDRIRLRSAIAAPLVDNEKWTLSNY